MKSKIILAGLLASIGLSGSSTLALASSCSGGANGAVSCDTFDLFTNTNAIVAAKPNQSASLFGLLDLTSAAFDTVRQAAMTLTSGISTVDFSTSNSLTIASTPVGISSLSGEIYRAFTLAFVIEDHKIVSGSVQSVATEARTNYTVAGRAQQTVAFDSDLAPHINLDVRGMMPVPGPEAGAGLGALAMGGAAFWMARRRKDQAEAA